MKFERYLIFIEPLAAQDSWFLNWCFDVGTVNNIIQTAILFVIRPLIVLRSLYIISSIIKSVLFNIYGRYYLSCRSSYFYSTSVIGIFTVG